MDPTSLDQSFRRSTVAGFLALAVSLGGHALTAGPSTRTCGLRRIDARAWLFERFAPDASDASLAGKVARAALALALQVCA